jgi:hypothetical protein
VNTRPPPAGAAAGDRGGPRTPPHRPTGRSW